MYKITNSGHNLEAYVYYEAYVLSALSKTFIYIYIYIYIFHDFSKIKLQLSKT